MGRASIEAAATPPPAKKRCTAREDQHGSNSARLSSRTSNLCDRCSTINLGQSSLHSLFKRKSAGFKFSKPGRRTCRLCQFLSASLKSWNVVSPAGQYRLSPDVAQRVVCSQAVSNRDELKYHSMGLKVSRDSREKELVGWILPSFHNADKIGVVSGRRLDQARTDFDIVRGWLSFCGQHHRDACRKGPDITLPGFHLIDCETKQIVPSTLACKYSALSYVWGSSTGPTTFGTTLPAAAPRVIEDAIQVNLELGIRFLWVDRYCINQENASEKHLLIQNMNRIYQGAYVTIVDAAGAGSGDGLPGVSVARRDRQPSLLIHGVRLVAIPDVVSDIQASTWSSRGWTYQEGLLSRRRLVFTRSQVYFQCEGMHCCEAIHCPLEKIHTKDMARFREDARRQRAFPLGGVGKEYIDVLDRVCEFLQRKLSYDSDALAAFLGVLEAFREKGLPLVHLWGLPILLSTRRDVGDALLWSLFWEPVTTKDSPLHISRRDEFPSWSWVHFRGIAAVRMRYLNFSSMSSRVSISVQARGGKPMGIDEALRTNSAMSYRAFEPYLIMDGWMTRLYFVPPSGRQMGRVSSGTFKLQVWDKHSIRFDPLAIAHMTVPSETWQDIRETFFGAEQEVLLVSFQEDSDGWDCVHIRGIVLASTRSGSYKRLGWIEFLASYFFRENKENPLLGCLEPFKHSDVLSAYNNRQKDLFPCIKRQIKLI